MKYDTIKITIVAMLIAAVVLTIPAFAETCTDSDGGINYSVKGNCQWNDEEGTHILEDFCTTTNRPYPAQSYEGQYIYERFCDGTNNHCLSQTDYCPNGCRDGTCIQNTSQTSQVYEQITCVFTNNNSTTVQQCHSTKGNCVGTTSCVVDVTGTKEERVVWESTCGGDANTIIDGQNEYVQFNCNTPLTCTDSDGGINYSVKGSCWSGYNGENVTMEDYCTNTNQPYPAQSYEGKYVYERVCNSPYTSCESQAYPCPNGCKDGACIQNTPICTDSDGGINYTVKGTTYDKDNGFDGSSTDYCQGSAQLVEFYCNSQTTLPHSAIQYTVCPYGCSDGACIQKIEETKPKSNPNSSPTVTERTPKEVVITPTESNKPINLPSNDVTEKIIYVCNGCSKENNCYSIGYRMNGEYCDSGKSFTSQLNTDASCENGFECQSNVCASGKCISGDLLQRILSWFKRLFGM